MSESSDTRRLCAELVRVNALVLPIVGNKWMPAGWPDRYIHHAYWQGWIEFKAAGGRLSLVQQHVIRRLNERSSLSAIVVRHPDQVEDQDGNALFVFHTALELLKGLRERKTT